MSASEDLVGKMTVAQLAALAGRSIADVVELVLGNQRGGTQVSPPSRRGARKRKAASTAPAGKAARRNTRTQEGRAALEQAIMDFLSAQTEPVSAQTVRAAVGGTSAQVRTRLNALIEAGKVKFTGRASGTRYSTK